MDSNTAEAIKVFLARLLSHKYEITGAILFGSRARGSYRADSDVDVAILLPGQPGHFLTTKLAMADIAYDVLLETGIYVQALPIWEEQWAHPETYSNPYLLHNIQREGIHL